MTGKRRWESALQRVKKKDMAVSLPANLVKKCRDFFHFFIFSFNNRPIIIIFLCNLGLNLANRVDHS